MLSFTIFCLVTVFTFVHAIPVELRDVVRPPITYPTAGVVWEAGSKQTVTWDTSGLPANDAQITNPLAKLILGRLTPTSLNLQFDNPLAQGLSIRAGKAEITVPNVPQGDNYIIVLFGDSGNHCPPFTIVPAAGGAIPPSASPSPSPAPASSSSSSALSSLSADRSLSTSSSPLSPAGASSTSASTSVPAAQASTTSNAASPSHNLALLTLFMTTIMSLGVIFAI